jgi:anti-anti-sigma factor
MMNQGAGNPTTHSLSVEVRCVEGVTYITLAGRLDAHTSPQVYAVRLPLTGSRTVVFDVSSLDCVDAAGIRALLRLEAAVTGAGGTVEIAGVNGIVHHMLSVENGFDADVDIGDDIPSVATLRPKRRP